MSSTAITVDLVLKGGKIATSTSAIEVGIAVDQGKIVALAKRRSLHARCGQKRFYPNCCS